jgi:hypothetical protein
MAKRPLPEIQSDLKRISNSLIDRSLQASKRFSSTMSRIAGELTSRLIDATDRMHLTARSAQKAQALAELATEYQKQLNTLDYDGTIKPFINEYDYAQTAALESLRVMEVPSVRLAPIDSRALTNIKALDLRYLSAIGGKAIEETAFAVANSVLLGAPRSAGVQAIRSTLSSQLQGHAATYYDTAIVRYDRTTTMRVWTAAEIREYLYRGPNDIKNRPFCHKHVGKVYTLDQIKAMDQDPDILKSSRPLLPVLTYGGGWNCRHIWSPIPPGYQHSHPLG